MKGSTLGKVKSQRWWVLMFFIAVATFFVCPSEGYAFDVTLQWQANQEPDLAGYKIYYKPGHSGDRIKENYTNQVEISLAEDENPDPGVVEFTLRNLTDGENYVFVVTAFDSEDPYYESDTSNEASTDENAPGQVTNLTGSHPINQCSNNPTVTMNWSEAVDPEPGSGLGGYSWLIDGLASTLPDENMDIDEGTTTVSGNLYDGLYWFHIRASDKAGRAGVPNWGETAHYGPFCIDTFPPGVESVELISGTTIEITYTETGMKNAMLAANYALDNGAIVSGVTDVTGAGKIFDLSLTNAQSYMIYTMTVTTSGVSGVMDVAGNPLPSAQATIREINDTESDGMADDWEIFWFGNTTSKNGTADTDGDGMLDVREYTVARANPQWGANWWTLSPLNWDSDGDGISDNYEVDYGLNPVDASDRDLDKDDDGWTNYEEYLYGYAANDANSPVPAPPQVKEGIPGGTGPIPSNSVFALRLEATEGINIAEPSGVTVTVNDGTSTYERNLNNSTVRAIPLDSGVTTTRNVWIAYYRSNETAMSNEFLSGVTVTATFEVTDVREDSMTSYSFSFRIQTAEEEAREVERSPLVIPVTDEPGPGLTTSGITDTASPLYGAAIVYDSSLPTNTGIVPYFGPTEDIPVFDVSGYTAVGVAMNLLPPAVFPSGVTLVIPCPGYTNVSVLYVYYYDGQQWVLACDSNGNVQPGGVGWMVPGSRVNHNGDPSWIEIKVYHFSAVIVGTSSGTAVTVQSGGGGGCFIATIAN